MGDLTLNVRGLTELMNTLRDHLIPRKDELESTFVKTIETVVDKEIESALINERSTVQKQTQSP